MEEQILLDLELAEKLLSEKDYSIVVVKNGEVLTHKTGEGIKPILEAIDELQEAMYGTTVGDRILGKASALLCVYAHVTAVYSPQATKTALAVLITAGIVGQADTLVPYISNKQGDGMCPFEKMLIDIDSSEKAYTILKKAIVSKA